MNGTLAARLRAAISVKMVLAFSIVLAGIKQFFDRPMIKRITLLSLFSLNCFLAAAAQVPLNVGVQILKAEDARRYDKTLEDLIKSSNLTVRHRAALAAGRIGDDRRAQHILRGRPGRATLLARPRRPHPGLDRRGAGDRGARRAGRHTAGPAQRALME